MGEVCPGWGGGPTDWGFSGAFVFRGTITAGEVRRDRADVELHAPTSERAGSPQGGFDLTGDGLDDLRVSAQERNDAAGAVYVVSDPPNWVVDLGDYPLLTGDPGSNAGSATESGGDLDGKFDGALELSSRLAGSRDVKRCLALQWFRFAFGRAETAGDACSLEQAQTAFEASGWNTRELMIALTQTEAFSRSAR